MATELEFFQIWLIERMNCAIKVAMEQVEWHVLPIQREWTPPHILLIFVRFVSKFSICIILVIDKNAETVKARKIVLVIQIAIFHSGTHFFDEIQIWRFLILWW